MGASNSNRLLVALALVAFWAGITVSGSLARAGQGSLAALVSQQVVRATPAAQAYWFQPAVAS